MIHVPIFVRNACVCVRVCVFVCVGMGGRGELVIANEVLKMRKVIEFQCSWIVVYYKIHFCILLQPDCAGEVSVVIVIDQ